MIPEPRTAVATPTVTAILIERATKMYDSVAAYYSAAFAAGLVSAYERDHMIAAAWEQMTMLR